MRGLRKITVLTFGILVLAGMVAWQVQPGMPGVQAAAGTPSPTPAEGPARRAKLSVPFTSYDWWLSSWSSNKVLCELWVEHEGLPQAYEVSSYCDASTYYQYTLTKPCPQAQTGGDVRSCPGVYFHFAGSQAYHREVNVDLQPPSVGVTVSGCDLAPPQNRCSTLPDLVLTGEEPLPNETIIAIHGRLAGEPFDCPGSTCSIPIPATGSQGLAVEFWADSSYGDSTKHYTAQVRAIPYGNFMAPEGAATDQQTWYVDVLSTQWRGAPLASCSEIWESFPALNGLPTWLQTPDRVDDLTTYEPLYYLAGVLIEHGDVDASACPDGGLDSPGVANYCG
ncbi:MAG TPA: hypothetical protein VF813_05935, partial [Anaerolineaceae bacterium]